MVFPVRATSDEPELICSGVSAKLPPGAKTALPRKITHTIKTSRPNVLYMPNLSNSHRNGMVNGLLEKCSVMVHVLAFSSKFPKRGNNGKLSIDLFWFCFNNIVDQICGLS